MVTSIKKDLCDLNCMDKGSYKGVNSVQVKLGKRNNPACFVYIRSLSITVQVVMADLYIVTFCS